MKKAPHLVVVLPAAFLLLVTCGQRRSLNLSSEKETPPTYIPVGQEDDLTKNTDLPLSKKCQTPLQVSLTLSPSPLGPIPRGNEVTWLVQAKGCTQKYFLSGDRNRTIFSSDATFNRIYSTVGTFTEAVWVTSVNDQGEGVDELLAKSVEFTVQEFDIPPPPLSNLAFLNLPPNKFKNVGVGLSDTACVTLTNFGDGAATALAFDALPAPFAFATSSCTNPLCGSELGPRRSCDVAIGFNPTASGNFSSRLVAHHADSAGPRALEVVLQGTTQLPNCSAIHTSDPSLPSGTYKIQPDPIASMSMDATCDMETDGGGWTLVLHYRHLGGTNPALRGRTASLPLAISPPLGPDESIVADQIYWGHAKPAMLSKIAFTETRFYCATNHHSRKMHFKTSRASIKSYITTGIGSMSGIENSFFSLAGHNSLLPGSADSYDTNEGDYALTQNSFYETRTRHWHIRGGGNGDRWECDDNPQNYSYSTHHQVWVR